MKKKKILTLEDLYSFYSTKKRSMTFSAEKQGYQIGVMVPATFETEQSDSETMMFANVKAFHCGRNRNGSSVTMEAAEQALSAMDYKPVLAHIVVDDDGEEDFSAHDYEVDEDGNITYLESQVGSVMAGSAHIEHDEEKDRDYVFCKVAIPRGYTYAADIIERRGGTDVSVELLINECSYNAKDKYLELTSIEVAGITLLGAKYEPGMSGAKLQLKDFAAQELPTALFSGEQTERLINALENLNESLNKNNYGKEDETMDEERMELEEEVTEQVTESEEEVENTEETETVETEEVTEETPSEEFEVVTREFERDGHPFSVSFSVSHEDIRRALYSLISLAGWEAEDNDWYGINSVYDDHFIARGFFTDQIWGQNYTVDGDNVDFSGDRYALHAEYLTDEELESLNNMRANYSAISEKLAKYELAELNAQRDEILNSEKYAQYAETEAFKNLREHKQEYSLDELKTQCELAFAAQFDGKPATQNFSAEQKQPRTFMFGLQERTGNSFLDGLHKIVTNKK